MGSYQGSYSRFMFDSKRQYVKERRQQVGPVVDADVNDGTDCIYEQNRAFLEEFFGESIFFGDAFKVVGISGANTFRLEPGRGFVTGNMAYNAPDGGVGVEFVSDGGTVQERNIYSVSTGLVATILTDTAMDWVIDSLVGRWLVPNVADGTAFEITANTETAVTITGGDITTVANKGDSYRLNMPAPPLVGAGDRTDSIWLNLYLDEIDGNEDPSLMHDLGSGVQASLRMKARTIIEVIKDSTSYPHSSPFQDYNAHYHYVVKLAHVVRHETDPNIAPGDVTDARPNVQAEALSGSAVRVSSNDTTPGHLLGKLQQGPNIVLSEVYDGGNEKVQIEASGGAFTDELIKVSSTDTGPAAFLLDKVVGGINITLSKQDGGTVNEKALITCNAVDENVKVSPTDGVASGLQTKVLGAASGGIDVQKTGGPSPAPEYLEMAVKDLPWDASHLKTDGVKAGHIAGWTTGGVPTTLAPGTLDKILVSNGPGNAPEYKVSPYTPATSTDWSGDPSTVKEALDRISASLATLLGGPIP